MQDLAEGIARFQEEVFPGKAELFAQLANHHAPHTLFISCSDARVVPELITGTEPGDLFVIRTAGNLVPAFTPEADGIAASIEYAVAALGVKDIVICGHSACGAMTSAAFRQSPPGCGTQTLPWPVLSLPAIFTSWCVRMCSHSSQISQRTLLLPAPRQNTSWPCMAGSTT